MAENPDSKAMQCKQTEETSYGELIRKRGTPVCQAGGRYHHDIISTALISHLFMLPDQIVVD